uniref:Tetraspanin 2b n=1 Tax=Astyanax mexicanus TaxID=7994 RepID=A0A8B9J7N7_ASTMX
MGKVEGGMKCVKYLLFIFNFIFWYVYVYVFFVLCVCVCVCVCTGVYILIVAGGLVMLVGFFGCCGAVRESQCLLGSHVYICIYIFIIIIIKNNNNHNNLNCCGTASTRSDCESAIEEFFNSKLFIIGYVGIGIAGVMIIGMIFSMVLCCAIRNSREVI